MQNTDLQSRRFLFLDALRGIAALYVAIFHFYSILKQKTGLIFPDIIDFFLLQGPIGVQIFFVLSGFVIAYSIHKKPITLAFFGRFILRRSIRLDPPYWMVLFLTLFVSLISIVFFTKPLDSFPSEKEILVNLFYLQDFFQMERILHVSWTLCLEIQFYLFFVAFLGILFWMRDRFRFHQKMFTFDSPFFLLPFGLLFIFSLFQNSHLAFVEEIKIPGFFIAYWYPFFMGVVLCWVHEKSLSSGYLWLFCSFLVLFFLLSPLKQIGEVLVISLMIHAVGVRDQLQWLISKPIQYLGKISYSLYLTHWLFAGKLMDIFARRLESMDLLTGSVLLGVCIGVAIVTAHIFHLCVELPSLRWSHRLKTFSFSSVSPKSSS